MMRGNIESRRRFLQSSAALAAVGTFPSLRSAEAAQLQGLVVRTPEPLNAEPSLAAIALAPITPARHFYVRNHGPMPKVEVGGFKIRVEGLVQRPVEFSLAEIKERFRQTTSEATLTCAGNRRQEISQLRPVAGVQWDAGAIGNARWTGAALAEVLRAAEIKDGAKHVWFDGLDRIKEKDGSVAPFGGSIPLEKAVASDVPALIAHAMNDEPLSAEHGFPLRTIVPGYIGARSVKWLAKITVSDRPSPNHYVAEAYKLIQSDSKDEMAAADPIFAIPVNAAICAPAAGATIKAGRNPIRGYALPSGEPGCTIGRVEISRDGGQSWTRGELIGNARPYAWQLWTAELNLAAGKHDLIVRAIDSRGKAMPERGQWNAKGYMYNGWHRVSVEAA